MLSLLWMPQFVHRSGRAELCQCTLEQFLQEELFHCSHCPALPETLLTQPGSWPEHLNFFGPVQTKPVSLLLLFSIHGTLLLASFCRCLSCHLPLLMPLQHRAHQATAVWVGAVSVTSLHLKNWSQIFDYNFVAFQH